MTALKKENISLGLACSSEVESIDIMVASMAACLACFTVSPADTGLES